VIGALDYLMVVLYFAVIIGVGLYKGRNEKSMEGFALGDRRIPWWAVLASILAAEVSAATFLGAPVEGFVKRNFAYAQLAIGTVLARVIVGYLFIKPYYDYRVISIYEFLMVRFGVPTKNAASAVFLLTRALASGTRLYVGALVLVLAYEMVSGVKPDPVQELVIYIGALTVITAITAIYTTLGGIKAVVWTDVIQACVMYCGLGFAIWALLHGIPDGWAGAKKLLTGPKDLSFWDSGITVGLGFWGNVKSILEADYTIWAAFLGATFITMATHGTDQDMVQRMLTAKDHVRSRLALILSGLADLPIVFGFLFIGILLYAFYQTHHDPNLPAKESYVFAYYILHELPSGIKGLLVAGVFATAMGSLSTALNALATSYTKDWYVPYVNPKADERSLIRATRWSTVVFSVILIIIGALTAWAVIILKSRIIPIVLGIFGYTYGSLLGIFMVGMITRNRGSNRGNIIGMVCGFIAVAILSGLYNDVLTLAGLQPFDKPDWLPVISFPWRIMFGTIVTMAIALCFKTPDEQVKIAADHIRSSANYSSERK
jgi:solute:Na+ symporter, SSS family